MNILALSFLTLNLVTLSQAAFLASVSSALQSLSTSTSGINFSSGVYTVLILPRSSTRASSSSSSTSSSTSSRSSTSTSASTSTVTPTTTVTPTATSTVTPTTTVTPTSTSTRTTTVTPTTTITPTSSVCSISVTTVSIFPSSYCTTIVLCGPAVSGCPVYNSSFMSQLSSLASSTTRSSSSTSSDSDITLTVTSTSTSTSTISGTVISSVSTGVVSSGGQTIVTSGAIVIEINDDGSTSTVFEAASARKYRANSTNSSGAFLPTKSGLITAVITLLTAFLLGIVTI